jgi:hypothetical protein
MTSANKVIVRLTDDQRHGLDHLLRLRSQHGGAASSRQARRSSLPSPETIRRSGLRFGAAPSSAATPYALG